MPDKDPRLAIQVTDKDGRKTKPTLSARFGRGDVQWVTAGRGIVHSEMFPLLDDKGPNPLELFQIWLNLPSADKMVDAHFTMFWDDQIHLTPPGAEAYANLVSQQLHSASSTRRTRGPRRGSGSGSRSTRWGRRRVHSPRSACAIR